MPQHLTLRTGARAGMLVLLSAALPTAAYAHAGESIAPHDLWSSWTLSLPIVLPLVVVLVL